MPSDLNRGQGCDVPYLGSHLRALQGLPARHAYMVALVQQLSREVDRPLMILEIGSWAGGSAITWGHALQRYHSSRGRVVCVDHWREYLDPAVNEGSVYQVMTDAARSGAIHDLFRSNIDVAGLADIVIELRGASRDTLPLLAPGAFDIVFIDGSHAYEDVRSDLVQSLKLVRDGGVVCGDDLEAQMHEVDRGWLEQQANIGRDFTTEPDSGLSYHPGVTLAVGETFGKVSCWEGLWAMRSEGEGWREVAMPDELPPVPEHLVRRVDTVGEETAQYIGPCGVYNIIRKGAQYVAVMQALGELDLFNEPLGTRELSPCLLLADSEEELRRRITEADPEPEAPAAV